VNSDDETIKISNVNALMWLTMMFALSIQQLNTSGVMHSESSQLIYPTWHPYLVATPVTNLFHKNHCQQGQ
jgi:hypothetical protein